MEQDEMEKAKEELKALMNDLFVEDLKSKADKMLTSMSGQFQGAVDDFTRKFDTIIDNTTERVIVPHVNKLNDAINNIAENVNQKIELQSKLIDNFNIENKDIISREKNELVSSIKEFKQEMAQQSNTIFKQITDQEKSIDNIGESVKLELVTQNELIEKNNNENKVILINIENELRNMVEVLRQEMKQQRDNLLEQIVEGEKSNSVGLNKLNNYDITLIVFSIIEILLLLYLILAK